MKRYVLKKDLPTFRKGETFFLAGDLLREIDSVLAYSDYELTRYPNILKDWFEELPEEYERWRAGVGEEYFYISEFCEIWHDEEGHSYGDSARFHIGNYFKTREEAQKALDWLKAFIILRDDTKGFKPDWKNETGKYLVAHDSRIKKLWVYSDSRHQNGTIYFKSREDAEASIEKHERKWWTYFGVEDKEDK